MPKRMEVDHLVSQSLFGVGIHSGFVCWAVDGRIKKNILEIGCFFYLRNFYGKKCTGDNVL